jgi:hypothetical protein
LRVVGDLLGLLHGVPEVATERVVVQAITFGGTAVASAQQPALSVSVSMPRTGVPDTALRIAYAAHAAGRLTNGPASSQAGGREAMRLGVGAAALSSEAHEVASASGVPYHEAARSVGLGDTATALSSEAHELASASGVPYHEAARSVGLGDTAAVLSSEASDLARASGTPFCHAAAAVGLDKGAAVLKSKALAELRAKMGGAGIACKEGCGRLFDCDGMGGQRRRLHEYGGGNTAPCKGRAGPPNLLRRGQHAGELICCDKCGFHGKPGEEWTKWRHK